MANRRTGALGNNARYDLAAQVAANYAALPADAGDAQRGAARAFASLADTANELAGRAIKKRNEALAEAATHEGIVAAQGAVPLPGEDGADRPTGPLALRRDGSIQGEAFDEALLNAAWSRANARLSAGLGDAHTQFRDDPKAFDTRAGELQKEFLGIFETDAETKEKALTTYFSRYAPYKQDIAARYQTKLDNDRKDAALEETAALTEGLEKSAYLLGGTKGSDEQLSSLTTQAFAAINNAVKAGAITPTEGRKRRDAASKSLITARLQGMFDALESPLEKEEFAKGLAEDWAKDGALGKLSYGEFGELRKHFEYAAGRAREEKEADLGFQRERFAGLIQDDVASMAATGSGVKVGDKAIDAAEVSSILGPDKAQAWLDDRAAAQDLYRATSGMERLTADQIDARLAGLEPAAGAQGFAARSALAAKAAKHADGILKLRAEDPARAVETDPQVAAAQELVAQKADGADRGLVDARLTAQAALGIPELALQPLTNAEAAAMADHLTLLENDPAALNQAIKGMIAQSQATYGDHADEVMAQVLRAQGVDKETSLIGASLMRKMGLGQLPSPAEAKALDQAQERDMADKAMNGDPVVKPKLANRGDVAKAGQAPQPRNPKVPNAAQVERLRGNPDLAPDFDERFGAGSAEGFLRPRPDAPARRALPDGSVELAYPDGTIEIYRLNGEVELVIPKGAQ